jgi:hypothetical protein
MRICFPAETLQGLESPVFGHFGSAPGFIIVDADTMQLEEIINEDLHHAHGMCQPLKALGGRQVDGAGGPCVPGSTGHGARQFANDPIRSAASVLHGAHLRRPWPGWVRASLERGCIYADL